MKGKQESLVNALRSVRSEIRLLQSPTHSGPNVVVVFPNAYSVGMANLGFQTVFASLSERGDLQVERAFHEDPPRSVETGRRISDFDLIVFSISFELDVVNAVTMLNSSGIPLFSRDRGPHDPLILAGGITPTVNPLPLSSFIDLFVLGESESALSPLVDAWLAKRHLPRTELLEQLADKPGVYVPLVYGGKIPNPAPKSDFSLMTPAHTVILSPESEFENTFLVEVSRGCRNGCRFCGIREIQGAPRYHSFDKVRALIERHGPSVQRVGLVAADVGSNPEFLEICQWIVGSGRRLTASSVELTAAKADLIEALVRGGQRTLTLAPETGDDASRRLMGKTVSNEEIIERARWSSKAGVSSLKLYFLAGVGEVLRERKTPSEEAGPIVELVRQIYDARDQKGKIIASLSPIVPRKGTGIEGHPMPQKRHVDSVIDTVRRGLRDIRAVSIRSGGWFEAALEHALSCGTESAADVLASAARDPEQARPILRKYLIQKE